MADEISGGPPARSRSRTGLIVLVVAVLAVVGVLALRRGRPEPPVATPTPAPLPVAEDEVTPGPPTGLVVSEVCKPVATDRRTTLTVSFTLVNTTGRPIELLSVTPVVPLHTITSRGVEVRTGGCSGTGPRFAGGRIDVGGTVRATFRFGLPAECPAANTVLADVRQRIDRGPVRSEVQTVLNDLGGLELATCP